MSQDDCTCEFLILSLTSCSFEAKSKPEGAAMVSSKGTIVTSAFRLVCPHALSSVLLILADTDKGLGCSPVGSLGVARHSDSIVVAVAGWDAFWRCSWASTSPCLVLRLSRPLI